MNQTFDDLIDLMETDEKEEKEQPNLHMKV